MRYKSVINEKGNLCVLEESPALQYMSISVLPSRIIPALLFRWIAIAFNHRCPKDIDKDDSGNTRPEILSDT